MVYRLKSQRLIINILLALSFILFFLSLAALFIFWQAEVFFGQKNFDYRFAVQIEEKGYLSEMDLNSESLIQAKSKNLEAENKDNKTVLLTGLSQNIPILMYHYIREAPAKTTLIDLYLKPQIFEEQLEVLVKNNYESLFVSELAAEIHRSKKIDGNSIVLTFDDAYEDFYTQVFPLLKKYKYKATVYVIINSLDKKGYLTRAQVKELAASGLVEIGSHTFNHPNLLNLKNKDFEFEIKASREVLRQISGQEILSFAYPFGLYKEDFFTLASSSGYSSAVSIETGTKQGTANIWRLRRLRPNERSGEVFIKWLEDWSRSNY